MISQCAETRTPAERLSRRHSVAVFSREDPDRTRGMNTCGFLVIRKVKPGVISVFMRLFHFFVTVFTRRYHVRCDCRVLHLLFMHPVIFTHLHIHELIVVK